MYICIYGKHNINVHAKFMYMYNLIVYFTSQTSKRIYTHACVFGLEIIIIIIIYEHA